MVKKKNQENPSISVVMIAHRDVALLRAALTSIKKHFLKGRWELILVNNGNYPGISDVIQWAVNNFTQEVVVVDTKETQPGAARNLGVARAKGKILLFLDDDIECFSDLVAEVEQIFEQYAISVAGGPNLTPKNSNSFQKASGYAMESFFGAGPMSARYAKKGEMECDEHSLILCNLAVRRDDFVQFKGFPLGFASSEENYFMQQVSSSGGAMFFSDRLAVFHKRRANLSSFLQQIEKYALGRAQNLLVFPQSFSFLYFIPTFFFFYLISLPFFREQAFYLWPLYTYMGLSFFSAISLCWRKKSILALATFFLFPLIHIVYGKTLFMGLLFWFRKRKSLNAHG
ncbi:MAG: glycosyltransferase [Oligoflexia bacterium]|nr:glycosyltransferase [Oligoflexia bacterium]